MPRRKKSENYEVRVPVPLPKLPPAEAKAILDKASRGMNWNRLLEEMDRKEKELKEKKKKLQKLKIKDKDDG
jgi:hypothetical protein